MTSNHSLSSLSAWDVYGEAAVPHSYSPGYIAFSFVISLIGAWTVVELLHRQTGNRGYYNWFLLMGASVAMGGVAIWSMHFIGNQAIIMGDGSPRMRLMYSSIYTGISFVLPIIVMASSFLIFSLSYYPTWWSIGLGGTLAGSAIAGMHYLGERGINNYNTSFRIAYVISACIIAVLAASTALGLFFRFKSLWSSVIWKRFVCAVILAIAVSLMHWVAILGTDYYAYPDSHGMQGSVSSTTAGWICGLLSTICCITLVAMMVVWQRYIVKTREKAQDVVLAMCVLDPEGRIMLNPAGMVPSTRITRAFFDDVWEEDFYSGHPVFCWMYRVSHNWKSINELIPAMRSHIHSLKQAGALESEERSSQSHTKIFREQFCIAASELANRLDEPLEDLGILYDKVIATGTTRRGLTRQIFSPSPKGSMRDVESINARDFGRGQLLFLVKHASVAEAGRLQASGYAFAPVNSAIGTLSRYSQVEVQDMRPHIDNMLTYKPSFHTLEPGVHFSVFCMRPNMHQSFDVLVDKRADNLLPSIQLRTVRKLERWQQEFINEHNGWKAKDLMKYLPTLTSDESRPFNKRKFITEMIIAMGYLSNRVGPELFCNSVLTATPYDGPCPKTLDAEGDLRNATVFAFRVLADIHTVQSADAADEYIPQRLFVAQQRVYPNSPDHAALNSLVHQEFSGIEASGRNSHGSVTPGMDRRYSRQKSVGSGENKANRAFRDHLAGIGIRRMSAHPHAKLGGGKEPPMSVSELSMVDSGSEKGLVRDAGPNPFGGILVSNEISVSVTECTSNDSQGSNNSESGTEMTTLPSANAVEVASGNNERDSFADKLFMLVLKDHVEHQRRINHHKSLPGNP